MRLRYDEVPLLVVVTPTGRLSRLSILAGPTMARERDCRLTVADVSGIPEDPTPAQPRAAPCSLFRTNVRNIGVTGGLQYAQPVPGGAPAFGARITQGRSNLAHEYTCCSLRMRSRSVTIGYRVAVLR